jgi:hypothetical protein
MAGGQQQHILSQCKQLTAKNSLQSPSGLIKRHEVVSSEMITL